jgi:hypothetical protein
VHVRPVNFPCGCHVIDLSYDDCCKDCSFVGKLDRKIVRFGRAIRQAASQSFFFLSFFFY